MSVDALYTGDRPHVARKLPVLPNLDPGLVAALAAIALLGLVMVFSASVSLADKSYGDPLFFFKRQLLFLGAGLVMAWLLLHVPLQVLERVSVPLLLFAYLLLVLVLIPGIGREVNGARRWIPLGVFNLQASELAKLLVFVYLGSYLVRRADAVKQRWSAFLVPIGVMLLAGMLLLAEPDFGAFVVMFGTGLSMLFLAGVPLWRFAVLVGVFVGGAALLILTSPYRFKRLTGFLDPWADPFDSGFQLTQSLIAIGRGQWFGVGLGGSVQKMFYLPEAHTDFLFAVTAEELGLVGVLVLIGLYVVVVWKAFVIGTRSLKGGQLFGGYIAYGVGLWFGMQAFVNMGVNMGLLPTKGLTLPLMSYGGSSLITTLMALALLLRADFELRVSSMGALPAPWRAAA